MNFIFIKMVMYLVGLIENLSYRLFLVVLSKEMIKFLEKIL